MHDLPDYVICESIHENGRIIIYKGYTKKGRMPVIIKTLKEEAVNSICISRLIYEYEIIRSLDIDGIVRPMGLEQSGTLFALVMEDKEAVSLKEYMQNYPVNLQGFLDIAIRLTKAVGRLHQEGIIHRNIKPGHILIHPDTLQVYIIDFSDAVFISPQEKNSPVPGSPVGSLEYMPPEQTGRLDTAIDQRSDLYSLGMVFYELLTGFLPLKADNPAGWIYAHMSSKPKPPVEVNSDIPLIISDIIMKLLEKAVEKRYQSGYGLLWDLEECNMQLLQTGKIEPFNVGQFDTSPSLRMPQELYGREREKIALNAALEAVCEGRTETILLGGYPGIGKTMLINEALRPAVVGKGFYITGKSDQLEKNIPYACFAAAFGNLVRQLMTESRQKLDRWKRRIMHAVGRSGAVVTDIIPELEWLIGKQSPVDNLPPKEAESRFLMVFMEFVKIFSWKGHPLVIFLDDLQWADYASINLLKYIMKDTSLCSLLIVGAFRENEVNECHPLAEVLEAVHKKEANGIHISLMPLELDDVIKMTAGLLNTKAENVAVLSEDLYRKSGGNPFFFRQLLVLMRDEELLYFDIHEGCWRWKLEEIQKLQPGEDVVELILKKLQRLPEEALKIIKLAACIGNRFELETLAAIYGKSSEETVSCLMPLVREGLIVPVRRIGQSTFEFLHDRVQQAVYYPIAEDEKKERHAAIGRVLLQNAAGSNTEDIILSAMDHFNRSLELVHDPEERMRLAGYNLLAGRRAKASAAYKSALKYLAAGMSLLPDNAWECAYDLSHELYLETAQMEFLSGNDRTAEELFDTVIAKAGSELERANVYALKVTLYAGAGRFTDAVNTCILALGNLGIRIPAHPTKLDYVRELLLYKWYMRGKKIEDLLYLPEMSEPKQRKIAELLTRLCTVTLTSNPELYSLVILKDGNHAVRYGNTEMASVGYLGYGITIGSILGDYEAGKRYGRVCIQLIEKYDKSTSKCIVYFVVGAFISHWTQHVKSGLEYLKKAVSTGMEAGDVLVIGYAHCLLLENRYLAGVPLEKIEEDCRKKRKIAMRLNHDSLTVNALIYERVVSILQGQKSESLASGAAELDKDELLQLVKKDQSYLSTYYFYKLQLHFMAGSFKEALWAAKQAESLSRAMLGFLMSAEYNFYYSLAIAAAYPELPDKERKRCWRTLKKNQRQMMKWASFCKENFKHKYLLAAAEASRLRGRREEAIYLYDRAINSARENGYIQNEALSNELAARFYISQGLEKIARTYIRDAYEGYCRWGAFAKAKDLKARYPKLLRGMDAKKSKNTAAEVLRNISKISVPKESEVAVSLDRYFIDRAIESISNETDIDKLFRSFLDIAAQSIGADKGCLVLEKGGELFIEAIRNSNSSVTAVRTAMLEEYTDVSKAVIRYVARTLETVVINQREQAEIFAGDPYIAESNPGSIVCLPLLFQGIPFGVLYFENSFLPGAFTPERLESLKLLSAQIAYIKILQSYLKEDAGDNGRTDGETQYYYIDSLTERETEVLQLIAAGMSNKEIAEELDMTVNTVKTHIKNVYGKLQVNRRVQAVEMAKKLEIL